MADASLMELAVAHYQAGRLAESEGACRRVLGENPNHAEALHLLGLIAKRVGRNEEALRLIGQAIRLRPGFAQAHNSLGLVLTNLGQFDKAMAALRRSIELMPTLAEAHGNLGIVNAEMGQLDAAIDAYRRAIELKPAFFNAHNNLGNALAGVGRLDEAVLAYRRAIELQPSFARAHCHLGNVLSEKGQFDEAIARYRRAIELDPNDSSIDSNLLYMMRFHPRMGHAELFAAHVDWAKRQAHPLKRFIREFENDRDPQRRLRIGYVSPDFRTHAAGRFIATLLENHDHRQFEIFCYSLSFVTDELTESMMKCADGRRNITAVPNEPAAELIRKDRIDILVDLAMHTAGNRILLFARKPAPIQVTYLAYPGTTGLDTIDYRITDPYLDPPGSSDEFYSERSIRLAKSYWCYQPPAEDLEVSALPVDSRGFITFGCLNNFCKDSPAALEAWGKILLACAESRLLLHAPPGDHRDRVLDFFGGIGVQRDRIEFVPRLGLREYLGRYGDIDVGLDPFPYGGGTTTCDALWMGVPVVTLAGDTPFSRGGVSVLSNALLPELVTKSVPEYVKVAAELAGDRGRLRELRGGLRERMRNSPLMDAKGFARDIESLYREMWVRWCSAPAPRGGT
jgi:protein O-GlcNAc transferase